MSQDLFTDKQIAQLREEYGKFERISCKAGIALADKVGAMSDSLVWQLAELNPRIPFVTVLANNVIIRRNRK